MVTAHLPIAEWNKESVVKFITKCRKAMGIPVFKTKYAGVEFKYKGKPAVVATCWGGFNTGSWLFTDVPEKEFKELEERRGDWKFLLEKYAPEKLGELKIYSRYVYPLIWEELKKREKLKKVV